MDNIVLLRREKAENCFANAQSYMYYLSAPLDDAAIAGLGRLGALKLREKFKRPFFSLELPDGTIVKGVVGDAAIKVSFPDSICANGSDSFEQALAEVLVS